MSRSEFVVLPGLTVPLEVVQLALDLEQRGVHLIREDGDVLLVGPRERVTDDDRVQLRRWKRHLLAIMAYDADGKGRPQ